jgi:endonuclease-3 related protein
MGASLIDVYERLLAAFGPQHWWPGETPFEVIVGAVLVQNTAWKNVERAIANLREEGLLDPRRLYDVQVPELEELIRPAGYFRIKAARLRNVLRMVVEDFDGSIDAMFSLPVDTLRERLLGVKGVGPETADSILLYAGAMPSFVVDTYTQRMLARHGWIGYDADYHQIKEHFESELPADAPLFNEYHALIVELGKRHCKKTPNCEACPLRELLPEGGIAWAD